MTLDERIRDDLRSAVDQVPVGSPRGPIAVKRRGLRRRRTRRGVWMALSAIPIVIFLSLALPYDPNGVDLAGSDGVEMVQLADLAVPVAEREPALTDPEIWIGLRGPSPEFDTDGFGPELTFEPGEPSGADLHDRAKRAVYLGELDEEPFYIYSQSAPSFWDRLFEALAGNFSGDILGTSLSCCSGGDMDHEGGLPGFGVSRSSGEPEMIVAEWLGLSPDVSVVAYQMDGMFMGWQTPVGGVSSIRLDQIPDEIVFIAFNTRGEEVNRFAPSRSIGGDPAGPSDSDNPGAESSAAADQERARALEKFADSSAEFVSGGLAIELNDVPSELREVIELGAADQLFRVPINGEEVYVLLSQEGGHVYTQSCSSLSADDLPGGLQATCLERIVNGQSEQGVFRYPQDTE